MIGCKDLETDGLQHAYPCQKGSGVLLRKMPEKQSNKILHMNKSFSR